MDRRFDCAAGQARPCDDEREVRGDIGRNARPDPVRSHEHEIRRRDGDGDEERTHAPAPRAIEGQRLVVLFNDTPGDRTIRPGMEIVEINGHKAADLLDRFMPMAPADGDIETGKRRGIASRFAQYYWWLVEQSDHFTVKAADAAGKTVTVKLTGVTDEERAKNQNPVNDTMKAGIAKLTGGPRENLSLRFPKDPQIAEIRVRYFVGDNFRQWVENTFKTLREKGTETLIIDVRGNGGGDDMYGAMLVSCLTDKPFRYFDHINVKTITPSFKEHTDLKVDEKGLARFREGTTPKPVGGYFLTPKMHPGLAEQPPGKYPFLGRVFVVIDGGTFSTAADFCAVVHHLKRATFVGEETGGGYYGNNSGMMPTLTLPNSKVKVRLPLYEYWNAVAGDDGKSPWNCAPITSWNSRRRICWGRGRAARPSAETCGRQCADKRGPKQCGRCVSVLMTSSFGSWITSGLPELCHSDLCVISEMDKHSRLPPHNQEVSIKVSVRRSVEGVQRANERPCRSAGPSPWVGKSDRSLLATCCRRLSGGSGKTNRGTMTSCCMPPEGRAGSRARTPAHKPELAGKPCASRSKAAGCRWCAGPFARTPGAPGGRSHRAPPDSASGTSRQRLAFDDLAPLLRHELASRVRNVLDLLLGHHHAAAARYHPAMLFGNDPASGVRDVLHFLLRYHVAVPAGQHAAMLLGNDPAGRVRDVLHLLLRHHVAAATREHAAVFLGNNPAGGVGDVLHLLLRHHVAAPAAHHLAVFLGHHPTGGVGHLLHHRVRNRLADRVVDHMAVFFLDVMATANRPVLFTRHP